MPVNPVLLTSGTTGTPKGARRTGRPTGLASAIGLLERIPYRTGDISVIPTPLFHAWGLAQLMIAVTTASTAVLVRRFEPGATLDAVEQHRATVLAGEQSGHLDAVLERLADYTESRQELRQKIMNAMIYPIVLTVLANPCLQSCPKITNERKRVIPEGVLVARNLSFGAFRICHRSSDFTHVS